MTFNTSSWSVKEEINKAALKLEIPNFSGVLENTRKDQVISSKLVGVGRSRFALEVYSKGHKNAEEGMLAAFIRNESNHDVEVNCTITVDENNSVGGTGRSRRKEVMGSIIS